MATDIYGMLNAGSNPYADQVNKQQQLFQQQLSQATDPRAFIAAVGGNMGAQLGMAVPRLFGAKSEEEKKAEAIKQVMAETKGETDPVQRLRSVAERLRNLGMEGAAMQVEDQANKYEDRALSAEDRKAAIQEREQRVTASQEEQARKDREEEAKKTKMTNRLKTLEKKFPEMDEDQRVAIAEDDASWRTAINPPPKDKTEFERILSSLNLPKEEEARLRKQWVDQKLNPDPAGQKALANELTLARINETRQKTQEKVDKQKAEKQARVNLLASAETNAEDALNTSAIALNIAPSDWMDAAGQLVFSKVPWTDAKALNNLVSSLNSEKVLSTLAEMKAQSRTGASGLGAVSEKELTLLMARTRALDPEDKNFKENLKYVMGKWEKIRREARKARLEELGQTDDMGKEDEGAPTPPAAGGQPKPTKRWNPATGKLEDV